MTTSTSPRRGDQVRQHLHITVCSIEIDHLDPALIRTDNDGRRYLDFILARSGEVIQSVDRPRGQRTRPCGERKILPLTDENSPAPSALWSNGGCRSLDAALAAAHHHERARGSKR
jgi:hypothetical protein